MIIPHITDSGASYEYLQYTNDIKLWAFCRGDEVMRWLSKYEAEMIESVLAHKVKE